jgi:type I restriction enzyme S subunit
MNPAFQKTRLRFLLESPLMYGATESGINFSNTLPRYIRITDIRADGTLEPENAVSLPRDVARPYLLNDRDILLARSGATVGKAFLYRANDGEACFAGYLIRARCDQRRMLPEYLAYYLQSAAYWNFINRFALQATIQNVSAELYKEIPVTHPSVGEQEQIVQYLNEATARVDLLIRLRRQQMDLLREQRVALIQQAVTRGLNPNAAFKDSGVVWLGNIPKHWEVRRNKAIFREVDVRSSDGNEELLTVSHITGVTPRSQKEEVNMFLAESNEGYKRVEIGDLAINTMWAWMGALAFSKYRGIVSPSYNVYRFRGAACVDYYDLLFRSPQFVKEIIRHSTGIWESRLRLYPKAFFEIQSPVPPLEEQKAIVGHVDTMTGQTEAILSAYSRQLELLTEYRAALIDEWVTGQRAAKPIPESMCLAIG